MILTFVPAELTQSQSEAVDAWPARCEPNLQPNLVAPIPARIAVWAVAFCGLGPFVIVLFADGLGRCGFPAMVRCLSKAELKTVVITTAGAPASVATQ